VVFLIQHLLRGQRRVRRVKRDCDGRRVFRRNTNDAIQEALDDGEKLLCPNGITLQP